MIIGPFQEGWIGRPAPSGQDWEDNVGKTNLEIRLRIRLAGVVSKKLIGDLKSAKVILSCSFLDTYIRRVLAFTLFIGLEEIPLTAMLVDLLRSNKRPTISRFAP
jgi:hypothetical protein